MGCSIGNAVGLAKAGGEDRPIVATIGDSTFLHSGIPPLIDAVYNRADISVLLLDNHTIAMTGGQDHPGTGRTLRGEETHRLDFEQLIRSLGVEWIRVVDSYELGALYQAVREATCFKGVAVVIADRPCVLDPVRLRGQPFEVLAEGCTACQACMNLGCPSIVWGAGHCSRDGTSVEIDPSTCIGCSLCVQLCPTDCIRLRSRSEVVREHAFPAHELRDERSDQTPDASARPTNVLVVGVGGQGVLMISNVLAQVCARRGLEVKQSEVHGMAKRGGVVFSHVRFGGRVWSPTIPRGEADVLVALEWAEGLRWLPYLRSERGTFVADTQRIVPPFACRDRRLGASVRPTPRAAPRRCAGGPR